MTSTAMVPGLRAVPDGRGMAPRGRRVTVTGHEEQHLTQGWQVAPSAPGACAGPDTAEELTWFAAQVPGTVAAALGPAAGGTRDLDAEDWWFRTTFTARPAGPGEQLVLCLDGVATVADIWLDGELLLQSTSMWAAHELDLGLLAGERHELVVCCRALRPLLALPRRPRARWRTRLVAD
ncbi:MAG: hypothetical protein JWP18_553, partial [Solirubrobacterales bacterium]|nr:hypothetical protein [Solirubrobacterales bacterium]